MATEEQKTVRIAGLELRFLITDKNATVFEFAVPPGARVPIAHYHQHADEILYGVEGIMTTTVDGDKREVASGDAVFIPRGAVHHHENLNEHTARALIVITPGTIGRGYFEEMAEAINASDKPDQAKVQEIMMKHGLTAV